jgi:hypothetical protein
LRNGQSNINQIHRIKALPIPQPKKEANIVAAQQWHAAAPRLYEAEGMNFPDQL